MAKKLLATFAFALALVLIVPTAAYAQIIKLASQYSGNPTK